MCITVLIAVFFSTNCAQSVSFAQMSTLMPQAGTMIGLTAPYVPPQLVGVEFDEFNPFHMNFLISRGEKQLSLDKDNEEYMRFIKYFLAALTIPEGNQWVNLSPYEGNRIIEDNFGKTAMGKDLLAQDYILKQLAASLVYPEEEIGNKFWGKVREGIRAKYGQDVDVPLNMFNRVWIVPSKADVYEDEGRVWVIDSHLKVMLEKDYVALAKYKDQGGEVVEEAKAMSPLVADVMREVVIPELEREVNEGAHFSVLRQIYHAMILATWYKRNLKESILGQVYADKGKVGGIELEGSKEEVKRIYDEYVESFRVGAFNYIKEEYDPVKQEIIPRKYFSGGFDLGVLSDRAELFTEINERLNTIRIELGRIDKELKSNNIEESPKLVERKDDLVEKKNKLIDEAQEIMQKLDSIMQEFARIGVLKVDSTVEVADEKTPVEKGEKELNVESLKSRGKYDELLKFFDEKGNNGEGTIGKGLVLILQKTLPLYDEIIRDDTSKDVRKRMEEGKKQMEELLQKVTHKFSDEVQTSKIIEEFLWIYKIVNILNPRNPFYWSITAEIHTLLGDYVNAMYSYVQASHLDPNNVEYLKNIAYLYNKLGDYENVVITTEKMFHIDSDEISQEELLKIHKMDANAYRSLGIWKEALKSGKKIDKLMKTMGYNVSHKKDYGENGSFIWAMRRKVLATKTNKLIVGSLVALMFVGWFIPIVSTWGEDGSQWSRVKNFYTSDVGGIDLDASLLNMQIRRGIDNKPLHWSFQDHTMFDFSRLTPVIISITLAGDDIFPDIEAIRKKFLDEDEVVRI